MTSDVSICVEIDALAPMPLEALCAQFVALQFLWFDLDGAHFGPASAEAPGATHIWGWNDEYALLGRLEDSRVVAGTVVRRTSAGSGVTATVRHLARWTDSHVGRMPEGLDQVELTTLELPGPLELLADSGWASSR